MSCFARSIASVKDSMNPCKAYLDTTWITPNEGNWQRKRSAQSCKGCFQHQALKKWKLSEWWPWWWSDMKVTCCDQIRTISSLQNVAATTPKRMFFPQMTFKDQKTMMMYIVELIKKALSFGQTPPCLPKMLFLGFHPCGSSFSVGGSQSCWILLIFIYGYPGYLWFIKFMSLHLPAWETVFVQQNGHPGRRTRWTLAPSTLRHPPFHGRSQKWKRRSHGNFVLECLGTGG